MNKEKTLLEVDTIPYLKQYDIPYPEHSIASSVEEAVTQAEKIGYPVVMKIVSAAISHKTEAKGVCLGIENTEQLRHEYQNMMTRVNMAAPDAFIIGVLICRQADDGLEVIVGAINDSVFGPTVMFGLGGIFAETIKDVTFRIAPLKRLDAEEMIREIKNYPVLTGIRGQAPRDLEALTDLLMSVSKMVWKEKSIEELDLNPVRLYEKGLLALDARMVRKS
jgi:acyl-CoA synthetase (NDP forming)